MPHTIVDTSGGGATITLDSLAVCLLISSVLYLFCLILARRKLLALNKNNPYDLNTQKLLVVSVATVCILRIMSFIGVALMDVANVRAHYALQPTGYHIHTNSTIAEPRDKNQSFYDSSMTVLFDLPNAIVVSTYVLLTLVWVECFLQSRFHTMDSSHYHSRGLVGYMIFNIILYSIQMVLYVLIFLPGVKNVVRTVLYVVMTTTNLVAVLLVFVFYVYLSVAFSGFPPRSLHLLASLRKISNVMTLWSASRIAWAGATLAAFLNDIELLQDSRSPVWSSLVLFLLFVFCEILPIVTLLDYSYLSMITFDKGASRDITVLASGDHDSLNGTSEMLLDRRRARGDYEYEHYNYDEEVKI
mmetsp:Transcript_5154/g.6829  ORF Transcript_5154/g.6829 Transcript_5154/m.6829 type:complete len:358 (+) Transcript_5154:116-1189(+)